MPILSYALDEMESYRKLILENIDYNILLERNPYDKDLLDGYVELMLEICCSTREFVRICGQEIPTGVVKSRFLKLNSEHISYIMDSLKNNTAKIGKSGEFVTKLSDLKNDETLSLSPKGYKKTSRLLKLSWAKNKTMLQDKIRCVILKEQLNN